MRVVHIAVTPLAGAPLRIVRALQSSGVNARLITLHPTPYGKRTFPLDLLFLKELEKSMEILAQADVLHFHHYFDLKTNPFGVDFTRFKGKPVRQFHSHPLAIGKTRRKAQAITQSPIPQLVIAQFHARYYPQAHIVPNIVPLGDTLYQPLPLTARKSQIIFSPSVTNSAFSSRWNTKGAPETIEVLKQSGFPLQIITNTPFEQCHAVRRESLLGVDDVVTGSYHLTTLDNMALGVVPICYLDNLTLQYLSCVTSAPTVPVVNVHLTELAQALRGLKERPEIIGEAASAAAHWMRTYYQPHTLVTRYIRIYEALLSRTFAPLQREHSPLIAAADAQHKRLLLALPGHTFRKLLAKLSLRPSYL